MSKCENLKFNIFMHLREMPPPQKKIKFRNSSFLKKLSIAIYTLLFLKSELLNMFKGTRPAMYAMVWTNSLGFI